MPSWLLPPQILLLAAPIALVLAGLALSAGERRARARREREALGHPIDAIDRAAAGDLVVIDGTLHVLEGPCERAEDGREVAALTVEARRRPVHPSLSRRPGLGDAAPRLAFGARAKAMVLRSGKDDVLVEGPIEVLVGSDETAPHASFHALSAAVRERLHAMDTTAASELASDEALLAPVFRSIADHAPVRVTGRIAKASDGTRTGYREHAKWVLVGTESSPVTIAYDGTPRHRGSTGALFRGVKRLDVQFAAMSVALVASILFGMAYAIGRPARTRARGTEMSLNGGKELLRARAAGLARLEASCAQPRPAALPAKWHCVGVPESFTLYLPDDVGRDEDTRIGGPETSYEGFHMRVHPHFDAEEMILANVEQRGTAVEIDGVPAKVLRQHHAIRLLFEEDGTGVPARMLTKLANPRLSFDVECDTDEACRDAWLALQTIRLW